MMPAMRITDLSVQSLDIPFKQAFAHASAVRAKTESGLVRVADDAGRVGFGEGCPRHYVTGETVESIRRFVKEYREQWMSVATADDVRRWVGLQAVSIDRNPAAWCAVETAFLDLLGKEAGLPIETLLGLPALVGRFQYSAVLGADTLSLYEKQLRQYLAAGFTDFKVKVTGRLQDDIDKLARLASSAVPNLRLRLDANNLWSNIEEAVAYLRRLPGRFAAIEEPLKVGDYDGCRRLARELEVPIILDESFLRIEQFAAIQDAPPTWIINIRVSKMGGLLRALAVAQRAKEVGIPIIVGAQVGETSILTRAALTVAHCYRDILVAQEGAFGTLLLEQDICEPSLMFGAGGRLDAAVVSGGAGLGLASCEIQDGNEGTC
jgi:L-alanine-DL-glutamate epimerase-like enolase superfamily enzyme